MPPPPVEIEKLDRSFSIDKVEESPASVHERFPFSPVSTMSEQVIGIDGFNIVKLLTTVYDSLVSLSHILCS